MKIKATWNDLSRAQLLLMDLVSIQAANQRRLGRGVDVEAYEASLLRLEEQKNTNDREEGLVPFRTEGVALTLDVRSLVGKLTREDVKRAIDVFPQDDPHYKVLKEYTDVLSGRINRKSIARGIVNTALAISPIIFGPIAVYWAYQTDQAVAGYMAQHPERQEHWEENYAMGELPLRAPLWGLMLTGVVGTLAGLDNLRLAGRRLAGFSADRTSKNRQ